MNQDTNAGSPQGLQSQFNNFTSNLANQIYTMLNNLTYVNGNPGNMLPQLIVSQNNIQSWLSGTLPYWTYAYDSVSLISWWNANYLALAQQIVMDIGPYMANWYNIMQFANDNNIMDFLLGNLLGNAETRSSTNYGVKSALNSNSNLTMSSLNGTMEGSASTLYPGGAGTLSQAGWQNFTSGTNAQFTASIYNLTMNADTTPIQDSNGDWTNNFTSTIPGNEIAKMIMSNAQNVKQRFMESFFKVFERFLTPLNNLDNDIWGYNW